MTTEVLLNHPLLTFNMNYVKAKDYGRVFDIHRERNGMSVKEIAAVLDITVSKYHAMIHEGKEIPVDAFMRGVVYFNIHLVTDNMVMGSNNIVFIDRNPETVRHELGLTAKQMGLTENHV